MFDLNSSELSEIRKWIDKSVRRIIKDELNKIGVPRLFIPGVVKQVINIGGKYYADVYLNGSSTASTNIPVNPTEASNISANTPVWIIAINFNNLDLFVLCRKLA